MYYQPAIMMDVKKWIQQCRVCQHAKHRSYNMRLYATFPVPTIPWEDIHLDFKLGFPRTHQGNESIFVVIDIFSKMDHFIPCWKTSDNTSIVVILLKEVVRLHGFRKSITSDRDTKFMCHFQRKLWKNINTRLQFSST